MKMWESQTRLEEGSSSIDADPDEILDRYDTENRHIKESEKKTNQLLEIEDYMINDKPIPTEATMKKFERVMNGETVKDNGIDYNKEIERIAEEHLKDQADRSIKKPDINEIIEDMAKEDKKPTIAPKSTQELAIVPKDKKPELTPQQIEYRTKNYENIVTK
jgi:hypothetical protein